MREGAAAEARSAKHVSVGLHKGTAARRDGAPQRRTISRAPATIRAGKCCAARKPPHVASA